MKYKYKAWGHSPFAGLIFTILTQIFASCSGNKHSEPGQYQTKDGMIWNTTYHIVWQGPPELSDSIITIIDDVGKSLNVFDDKSLVSKVNRSHHPIEVDDHFINVYRISKRINKESNGMFDPTLSPLINVWGFGPGHKATADTCRIDSLLSFTGIEKTSLKGNILHKENPGIVFNFSAIAKGYACDCVGIMFKRNGVNNYMVEIGGEIVCSGKNAGGTAWNIQIDKPIKSDGIIHETQAVISITEKGLATSGNYRNYHKSEGGDYGHTISPLTGRPIQTNVISATVVSNNAMLADALATACMASEAEEALKMCKRMQCPVMLVLKDTVIMSEGFRRMLITE